MRLARPYIPIAVRIKVAERQCGFEHQDKIISAKRLKGLLFILFAGEPHQLDHNPALINRPFNEKTGKYTPDANNPEFLIYRTKAAHDIKTRVRGDGAQLSDLAIARKRKRIERKKTRQKKKWPSRPFPKRQSR
jgi:hypothetical protein